MRPIVLCFSRSYLSHFLPELARSGDDVEFLHIVQTEAEERVVRGKGGKVVLVIETVVRQALLSGSAPDWVEPADFRVVTGSQWDPIYCDRHLPELDEAVRLKVAGVLQHAFAGLFATYDVAGVLSEPIALFPTNLLYYFIKRKGGRSLLWANAFFPGYFYFTDQVHLAVARRSTPMDDGEKLVVNERVTSYVQRIAQDLAGPVYHHKFASRRVGPIDYFRQRRGNSPLIYVPGLASQFLQALRVARVALARRTFPRRSDYMSAASLPEHLFYFRNLLGSRRSYDSPPSDYDSRNIFFPLQYEPEASLLYAAPDFRNQHALVRALAEALPAGHLVWVKEHPNQFGVLASREWRSLRRRHHNLRFVYGRENGRTLIKCCGLAVAITSTAGLDALIFGRQVIVLGDVFYRDFPGAIPVRSLAELASALNTPENYGVKNFSDELLQRLTKFGTTCYAGDPQPADELYDQGNMRSLYRAIVLEITAVSDD